MARKNSVKIVLGVANVGDTSIDKMAKFNALDEVNAFIDIFHARGYRTLDTARNYSPHAPGTSEPRLGAAGAGRRFTIDTKIASGQIGSVEPAHTAALIAASIDQSLADLKLPAGETVDVMYLHWPDRTTPFEETCAAMDKAYREGKFKRFGLSNYSPDEVETFVRICKEKGFVVPSVYQGQYNPVVRGGEMDLFPVLRKHDIAFYAYSPAGGGFFAGNHKTSQAGGRFDTSLLAGQIYEVMYKNPSVEAAADHARTVAAEYGINGHSAALRWTVYHSILKAELGDAVIIGASSPAQLISNLDVIEEGPLPKAVVDGIDGIIAQLGDHVINYHF